MLRAPIEVGDGAITGLGSVVTKDVQPHTMVVGVPARMIRKLDAPEAEAPQAEPEAETEAEQEEG